MSNEKILLAELKRPQQLHHHYQSQQSQGNRHYQQPRFQGHSQRHPQRRSQRPHYHSRQSSSTSTLAVIDEKNRHGMLFPAQTRFPYGHSRQSSSATVTTLGSLNHYRNEKSQSLYKGVNFQDEWPLPPKMAELSDTSMRKSAWSEVHRHEIARTLRDLEGTEDEQDAAKGDAKASDGGHKAWLFMLSACFIEAFLWGFTTSYGIFFDYYRLRSRFRDSTMLSSVGTCASGIPFLGAPIVTLAVARYPQFQRQMIWFGTLLCIASLIGASFATQDWHLLLSQGIGYGVGVLIVYYPMLSMVNSWFTARRGFAYGLLFAAAGASGTGLPFLISTLLKHFGYAWTLRTYSCGLVILVVPTFTWCRGRPLPPKPHFFTPTNKDMIVIEEEEIVPRTRPDWSILRNPSLLIFSFANLFQGLAYYIPTLYLPVYAETMGLSPTMTTLLVALLNASQIIAQLLLGFISDRTPVFALIPISTLGAAVLTLGLWYFGHTAATLLAFSVLFGLFTGGFTSLWARFNMQLSPCKVTQEFAYGLLAAQRGLGMVMAGPISLGLLRLGGQVVGHDAQRAYRTLILFVVASMGLSSLGGLGAMFKQRKR